MSAEEKKEIVRYVMEELFKSKNPAVVDEYYTSDFVGHEPPPGISPNREGIKEFVNARANAFSDSQFTIEDQIAEGDKVVTRWSSRHTHTGEFLGVPPTGKEASISGISIHRMRESRIAEEWTLADMLGLIEQLGVLERSSVKSDG